MWFARHISSHCSDAWRSPSSRARPPSVLGSGSPFFVFSEGEAIPGSEPRPCPVSAGTLGTEMESSRVTLREVKDPAGAMTGQNPVLTCTVAPHCLRADDWPSR